MIQKLIRALLLSLLINGWASSWVVYADSQTPLPPNTLATHNSSKWEKDIAAFEMSDKTNPPPKNCIVFVGSSSIRLWKTLAADFPGYPVVNRGFGGSQLADSVNFAERIILPYQPKQVVIFAGGNDLNEKKSPELVYGDFVALVRKIQEALPKTRIAYISISPTPKRWSQLENIKKLNSLIETYCQNPSHNVDFINTFPKMLGSDGKPKPDIYAEDQLHLNTNGYAIWKAMIKPYLIQP
jgi:lysophospholipase L1-like esterase